MPSRDAALGHSGALPAAAARAADLLRHPRGGGQGRVGDACRQAALLSGKPPDTTTTLSTPAHPCHPYHPVTTRCQPLPPPPFPILPPLPSGVRQHAPAARRRRRAETTRRARLHMVERSCPAARQPACMRPPPRSRSPPDCSGRPAGPESSPLAVPGSDGGGGYFLRSRTCVGADTHKYDPQAPAWRFRPPRFVAWELALVQLTEPTAEGATLWKKLASVSLARAP